MNNIWKRITCFALVLIIGCTLLPVRALAAENTYTIEIPDGEITAAALYAAIVALDSSFVPQKTTTGRLTAATAGIDVANWFEFEDRPGGGVKYVDGPNVYVVSANSKGNAAVSHNVLYSIHSFLLSGNTVEKMTCDYFDTGKYVRMMFYYEPVIESVIAQDAKGNAIALPVGVSAKLTDHDGGKFYHNDKATISAAPVDGFEVYAGSSKLAYNETTGMHELEVTIADSAAYTVIYKKKATEIANVTYTEIRTDAAGNVTTGISDMVTGATASAVYAVGDSLTYKAAPAGNWYVKSIKINNVEQLRAADFRQDRSCEVSYEITGAGAVNVTVELAEKYLTAKSGVQNVLFNPAKTVAQQMKANGTVYGTIPLEKLVFEAVIASGSKGNLPAALSWDSSGISYAFKSDAAWQPLDFAGDEYHHGFPTEIGAAAEIQITWAGNSQYPAVSAIGTVRLADCRTPAPAYDISLDSETEIGDIQAAAATAAAALGLTADMFQVPQNMQSQIAEMPAGTKKTFTLVALFDGNADYRPGQVKVSVEVTKAAILPATVTLSADAGKGTVTIKNASGSDVDLNNVYAADSPLTVHVTPRTSENAANYVQHIIVTEDGEEILKTEEVVNTATFHVRNSKTAHHYVVTVSYGFHELKLADTITPVKFNPFVAVADQMTGGQAKADAANERTLEQSILDALGICYNGEKLEYSDGVTITYHPWELRLEDEGAYRYAENTAVCPALDGRAENTDDSIFFDFGERWVDGQTKTLGGSCQEKVTVAYAGLSVTAEITLEEGRQELTLSGGVSDTTIKINSMDGQADRDAINQAAMSVVTGSKPGEIPQPPSAYLYAVDVTEANAQTPFTTDLVIPKDCQDHVVAVKISWDSTAEYIGTDAIVYVLVNCADDSGANSGMYKLAMDSAESTAIVPGTEIFVDGKPYLLDENCTTWIDPNVVKNAVFVTTYRYNTAGTAYGAYPTHMYVWYAVPADSDSDGEIDSFDVCRVAQLDDFFRYEGTSIHVSRSIGDIRFFTSVHGETCEKLMQGTLLTGALKGYRMTQAGTVFGKYSEESTNITLENGVCSDVYGGKAGKTFRVFSKSGQRNWFTGMLTNLDKNVSTIHTDILSRPYAVLECGGQSVTLYGAALQRSLYYVAAQNRDYFPANSAFDKLIEDLLAAGDDAMP